MIPSDRKFSIIFLELASVSPLLIMLGNLLPPVGLKIHYYFFGLLFLLSILWVAASASKKWLMYAMLFYLAIQFTFQHWDIKSFVDFFFGPFALTVLLDILWKNELDKETKKRYLNRFIVMAAIPTSIAVLQFFGLLPLRFLEAQYVNEIIKDGVRIGRPNGFLYHGSELCIIIFFLAAMQTFERPRRALFGLAVMLGCAISTRFKSITATLLILIGYYLLYLSQGAFYHLRIMSRKRLLSYGFVAAGILTWVAYDYSKMVYSYTQSWFVPTFLNGRGSIWNIYIEGIKDYTWWNYLFGSGVGSEFSIFNSYATPKLFWPLTVDPVLHVSYGTHNSVLGIFISTGLVGLAFIFFYFFVIYQDAKRYLQSKQIKLKFMALTILPVFTFGITIPVFEMAIYWTLFGFTMYYWHLREDDTVPAT